MTVAPLGVHRRWSRRSVSRELEKRVLWNPENREERNRLHRTNEAELVAYSRGLAEFPILSCWLYGLQRSRVIQCEGLQDGVLDRERLSAAECFRALDKQVQLARGVVALAAG